MDEHTIALDWIVPFLDNITIEKQERQNLFQIAGFPNWENVNSNMLAFYLNEEEEHAFGRLFFNSLLDCIPFHEENTRQQFESSFHIAREYTTNKGGRIDLLIQSHSEQTSASSEENQNSSWAIIIENKIYHHLAGNDLQDYWDSVRADQKIGVVLALEKYPKEHLAIDKGHFISISHQQLLQSVENNLSDFYFQSDDRHLLLLKEYFANIQSHYDHPKKQQIMLSQLKQFHAHQAEVEKLITIYDKLLVYLNQEVNKGMHQLGLSPSSTINSRSKHYYFDSKNEKCKKEHYPLVDSLRFWIDINYLRHYNQLECYLELYDPKNTVSGPQLKDRLKDFPIHSYLKEANGGKAGGYYFHLYHIQFPFNLEGADSLSQQLVNGLKLGLSLDKGKNLLDTICDLLSEFKSRN